MNGERTRAALLAIYVEAYRQEVLAEEDVFRTLPFFATALSVVIAASAYAAAHLPGWPQADTPALFLIAAVLLAAATIEVVCVLLRLSQAIRLYGYRRIGPETELHARLEALDAAATRQGLDGEARDRFIESSLQTLLLASYASALPHNRMINERRIRLRAVAASHLVRSLCWALAATIVIFVADKLGYLPRVIL